MKNLIFFILLLLIFALFSCLKPYQNFEEIEFSDLQYPFPVKTSTVKDNLELAYVDEGSGQQTIIFIHGLGSYLPAWQKNIAGLKDSYRCIALDLPGYGKSGKGVYPIDMEFYVDVLTEVMDNLDLESVNLAGHSMGGQIAMIAALKYPDRVKSLILIAPAGFEEFTPGEGQWFHDVMTVDFVRLTPVQQIRANVAGNFYNMPAEAEFMVTDRIALRKADDFEKYCYAVVKSVQGMVDQPVHQLLDQIRQPALIVFGENDNLIPNPFLHPGKTVNIAKTGAEKIPNSRLVMIPKCGHFAQFEKAEIVNRSIRDFLD